jgi:hypothetical protein
MRLEVRQRLPEHLASLSEEGWLESFTKTTVRSDIRTDTRYREVIG